MSPVGQGLGDTARQMKTMKVLFTGLAVGHYQPMADGDALHITRAKASSAVGLPEDTRKTKNLGFLVYSNDGLMRIAQAPKAGGPCGLSSLRKHGSIT